MIHRRVAGRKTERRFRVMRWKIRTSPTVSSASFTRSAAANVAGTGLILSLSYVNFFYFSHAEIFPSNWFLQEVRWTATSTVAYGAGFQLCRARWGGGLPSADVIPPLPPEHRLSTCQQDSEKEPLTEVLFALLFYFFSFIKSHSPPEPDMGRLKAFVNLWQCLSLDGITSPYLNYF